MKVDKWVLFGGIPIGDPVGFLVGEEVGKEVGGFIGVKVGDPLNYSSTNYNNINAPNQPE
eukprot:7718495-Ditylum_brightwellii.AAC.1